MLRIRILAEMFSRFRNSVTVIGLYWVDFDSSSPRNATIFPMIGFLILDNKLRTLKANLFNFLLTDPLPVIQTPYFSCGFRLPTV